MAQRPPKMPAGLKTEPGWSKTCPTAASFAQKRARMVQNGSTASFPHVEALVATWDISLRTSAHFYDVFANNFAFLLKIYEKLRKKHKNSLRNMKFTDKALKGAQKLVNERQK